MAPLPFHGDVVDLFAGSQSELQDRLVGGEKPGGWLKPAFLQAATALDPDVGAQSLTISFRPFQADRYAAGRPGGIVAVNADWFLEAGDDEFGVPVPVEVAGGGRIAHPKMVQSPGGADVLELEIATVGKGEVLFPAGRMGLVVIPLGLPDVVGGTPLVVGIIEAPRYPVGEEGVDVAVEIEVLQLDSPGPVRVGEAGLEGSIREFADPVVEIENIVHVLAGHGGEEEGADGSDFPHRGLGAVMVGARHVGDEEVGAAVAVEIGHVGTHREPGGVGGGLPDDVGKGAVPIVAVESVRILEVISDVDVGESVIIEIPPGHRVPAVPP